MSMKFSISLTTALLERSRSCPSVPSAKVLRTLSFDRIHDEKNDEFWATMLLIICLALPFMPEYELT